MAIYLDTSPITIAAAQNQDLYQDMGYAIGAAMPGLLGKGAETLFGSKTASKYADMKYADYLDQEKRDFYNKHIQGNTAYGSTKGQSFDDWNATYQLHGAGGEWTSTPTEYATDGMPFIGESGDKLKHKQNIERLYRDSGIMNKDEFTAAQAPTIKRGWFGAPEEKHSGTLLPLFDKEFWQQVGGEDGKGLKAIFADNEMRKEMGLTGEGHELTEGMQNWRKALPLLAGGAGVSGLTSLATGMPLTMTAPLTAASGYAISQYDPDYVKKVEVAKKEKELTKEKSKTLQNNDITDLNEKNYDNPTQNVNYGKPPSKNILDNANQKYNTTQNNTSTYDSTAGTIGSTTPTAKLMVDNLKKKAKDLKKEKSEVESRGAYPYTAGKRDSSVTYGSQPDSWQAQNPDALQDQIDLIKRGSPYGLKDTIATGRGGYNRVINSQEVDTAFKTDGGGDLLKSYVQEGLIKKRPDGSFSIIMPDKRGIDGWEDKLAYEKGSPEWNFLNQEHTNKLNASRTSSAILEEATSKTKKPKKPFFTKTIVLPDGTRKQVPIGTKRAKDVKYGKDGFPKGMSKADKMKYFEEIYKPGPDAVASESSQKWWGEMGMEAPAPKVSAMDKKQSILNRVKNLKAPKIKIPKLTKTVIMEDGTRKQVPLNTQSQQQIARKQAKAIKRQDNKKLFLDGKRTNITHKQYREEFKPIYERMKQLGLQMSEEELLRAWVSKKGKKTVKKKNKMKFTRKKKVAVRDTGKRFPFRYERID